jgi:hypothetical protein
MFGGYGYAHIALECVREHGGCGQPAGMRCRSDQNVEIPTFHNPRRSAVGRLGDDDKAALAALATQLRTALLDERRGRKPRYDVGVIRADIAAVVRRAPIPV